MVEKLSDGKTIIALIHNRSAGGAFNRDDRSELWISLSRDNAVTWTEPRFFMSTATTITRLVFGKQQYCITYCDVSRRQWNAELLFAPSMEAGASGNDDGRRSGQAPNQARPVRKLIPFAILSSTLAHHGYFDNACPGQRLRNHPGWLLLRMIESDP